ATIFDEGENTWKKKNKITKTNYLNIVLPLSLIIF
ncbi:unnamed protein product, partial [marine sediment metagenome]